MGYKGKQYLFLWIWFYGFGFMDLVLWTEVEFSAPLIEKTRRYRGLY